MSEPKPTDHHQKMVLNRARRIGITVGGGILLIVGIIAIPYPGPGWLIVFAALGILAQEYTWAKRLLVYAKNHYDQFEAWVKQQGIMVKIFLFLLTSTVVVLTLWLLNAYGLMNEWLNLGQDWVESPLFNK